MSLIIALCIYGSGSAAAKRSDVPRRSNKVRTTLHFASTEDNDNKFQR